MELQQEVLVDLFQCIGERCIVVDDDTAGPGEDHGRETISLLYIA